MPDQVRNDKQIQSPFLVLGSASIFAFIAIFSIQVSNKFDPSHCWFRNNRI